LSFFASGARCRFPAAQKDFVPLLEGTDVFDNDAKPVLKSDIKALPEVEGAEGRSFSVASFFSSISFRINRPSLPTTICIASKSCFYFPSPPQQSTFNPSPYLLL